MLDGRIFTDREAEVRTVFGWLDKLLGRGRKEPVKREGSVPAKLNSRVRCPSCGYEADESEFLQRDRADTICPKCGEDAPVYEF